ncbi:MAG: TolC family protein [Verrucomicrobiota bacterium]|nr:TolC family protein [Verrucomicrobiota bacterium]
MNRAGFCAALVALGLTSATHALTLEAALARTLQNNPEIRAARLRVEEAAGQRLVLRATGLPDVRVDVPGGLQGGKRSGERSVQPFAFAQGAFTQPVFSYGLPATFRRADLEVLIAEQRLNAVVLEQLHTARLAYCTAAYNDSLRAVGEAQRTRLAANAQTQNERVQAGQAERAAVSSAQVLEHAATPRIEESRRASSAARLQLATAMGERLTSDLPGPEGELTFAAVELDVDAETQVALERRTDLKLARLLVRAAREDERIAQAGYFPQIAATVSGTYIPISDIRRGSEGSARRSDDIVSSEARAGVAYTWRVIDNGRTGGVVLRQRALREANEAVLAKLEADVPRELLRLRNNLRALASRQEALSKASNVAEQTVRDVQSNLAQGLSSQLEYRNAETNFLQTRGGLLSVAYEQNVALAERDRITGRYFQFSEKPQRVH